MGTVTNYFALISKINLLYGKNNYICAMKFEISNITMSHRTFGGYFIKGIVNGVTITATTEDSEVYDWYNDDTEKELHNSALLHCEWKLEEQFLSL